ILVIVTGGMESGIIGGKEAKHHSRPYMASIQYINHHTCGGILIRQDYVLTAAHCLNPVVVVLGAYNINKKEKSQQRIPVIKYIQHPMFERNKKEDCSYDKLLIKVFSPSPVTLYYALCLLSINYFAICS
uniref:trypsin n=1 Tax=Sinocyclocheilus rhinocerous TaxID=307959 RepID=A0A673H251_9TELE